MCTLALLCVGEVAAHIGTHPNSPSSHWYAIVAFFIGVVVIAVLGKWAERLLARPATA